MPIELQTAQQRIEKKIERMADRALEFHRRAPRRAAILLFLMEHRLWSLAHWYLAVLVKLSRW